MRIKYGFYKEISVASEFSHSLVPLAVGRERHWDAWNRPGCANSGPSLVAARHDKLVTPAFAYQQTF